MYDPKFRMALLIGIIVVVLTTIQVLNEYVFGDHGLDFAAYLSGVGAVGGAIVGGFVFVWVCVKFITFERLKKTGFEASVFDEAGTGFNFPVSLSKFLPDVTAPPMWDNIHPVEAELLGFLNTYRDWPYDLTGENRKSIYQNAYDQWHAMRLLPNATPAHGIAALAQDLGKVYAYKEDRKRFPVAEFWKRDTVSFKRRCLEHGGLSAFVLSTLPSFRAMEERTRRAVLIAVRYRDDPIHIPVNCDPLAMDIYESLHKAANLANHRDDTAERSFNPTPADVEQFHEEVSSYLLARLRETNLNPENQTANSEGIYLGDGIVVLRLSRILRAMASSLTPRTRNAFDLWDLDGRQHPSWAYFVDTLRRMGVLKDNWENYRPTGALFNLRINDVEFKNCVLLSLDREDQPDLRVLMDALPKWKGIVDIEQDEATLIADIKRKSAEVDNLLGYVRDSA